MFKFRSDPAFLGEDRTNTSSEATEMNKERISNRLFDELGKLQASYNMLSKGLNTPGVDKQAIQSRLEVISERMSEVNRQLDAIRS